MLALDEHPARWSELAPRIGRFDGGMPLSSLAGETLQSRFRAWRGSSGRRYVFSVYDAPSCPAYQDALMIVAEATADGNRRVLSIGDTGCFPDLALAKARGCKAGGRLELHVHLLTRSRAERLAAINDLAHFERN